MTPEEPIWPSISSALDDTVRQLDALGAVGRARRADNLAQLRAIVANLDRPNLHDEEEPAVERPNRDDEERRRPLDGSLVGPGPRQAAPYDFGPKVREKLRRIALERSDW